MQYLFNIEHTHMQTHISLDIKSLEVSMNFHWKIWLIWYFITFFKVKIGYFATVRYIIQGNLAPSAGNFKQLPVNSLHFYEACNIFKV